MRNRFVALDELAVTVVHHYNAVRRPALGNLSNFTDLFHKQGRAQAVAPRTLNIHHANIRIDAPFNFRVIRLAVRKEINLLIADSKFFQGTVPVAGKADHSAKCVIRNPRNAHHGIARPQDAKQRHSQGMGSAHKVMPHKGIFRAECISVNSI